MMKNQQHSKKIGTGKSVAIGTSIIVVLALIGGSFIFANRGQKITKNEILPPKNNVQTVGKIFDRKGIELQKDFLGITSNSVNTTLTLDKKIQEMTEEVLKTAIVENKSAKEGNIIVMNPTTGEILALASISDKKYSYISDTFEPGGIFIIFTAAVGLEEGTIKPESSVDDKAVTVGGFKINCWNKYLHGKETFSQSVYNDCNPVFVKVAQSVGVEKFYASMQKFGFYDKTNIDLPGEANSIIHKKPLEIDMAVASFGQRFQVTPIQMISAYGAVANGGNLVKPQIIKEVTDESGKVINKFERQIIRNVISKQTSATLKKLLEDTVLKGIAKNSNINGYKIAAYTGTSETTAKDINIVSFVGFTSIENPEVSCIITLKGTPSDNFTGEKVAAPLGGKLLKDISDYLKKN